MNLTHLLNSDASLTLITAVLGTIWTLFRSSEWRRRLRDERFAKALEALEAGVEITYRTYVAAIQQSRADGKLTQDEKQDARRRARDAAVEFGRTRGIDVLRELGAEYMDLWIAKLVQRLKTS